MTDVMMAAFRDELEKIAFSKTSMIGDVLGKIGPKLNIGRSAAAAAAKTRVVAPVGFKAPTARIPGSNIGSARTPGTILGNAAGARPAVGGVG